MGQRFNIPALESISSEREANKAKIEEAKRLLDQSKSHLRQWLLDIN